MILLLSHSCDGKPQFVVTESIVSVDSSIKLIVRLYDGRGFKRHNFACCVSPVFKLDVVDVNSLDDHHVVKSYKEGDYKCYVSLSDRLL